MKNITERQKAQQELAANIAKAKEASQIKSDSASIFWAENGKLYLFDVLGNAYETTPDNLLSFIGTKEIGDNRIIKRNIKDVLATKAVSLSAETSSAEPEPEVAEESEESPSEPKKTKPKKADK